MQNLQEIHIRGEGVLFSAVQYGDGVEVSQG